MAECIVKHRVLQIAQELVFFHAKDVEKNLVALPNTDATHTCGVGNICNFYGRPMEYFHPVVTSIFLLLFSLA